MVIFIVGATIVGVIGYMLLSDLKTKDGKTGGKASPILFKYSLKTGDVDEKEVFKTPKDAGIKPCFLDTDLNNKGEGTVALDDEFDKLIASANKNAYEFMRNNPDSLGANSVQNALNDEQIFNHFPVAQEPCIVKVKSKNKK